MSPRDNIFLENEKAQNQCRRYAIFISKLES